MTQTKQYNTNTIIPKIQSTLNHRTILIIVFSLLTLFLFKNAKADTSLELTNAEKAIKMANYRAAIIFYEAHLLKYPNDGAVMIQAAEAYEGAKWWGRAVIWWEKYLEKFPNDPQTENVKRHAADNHRWLGSNFYIIGGTYRMAIDELKKSLAIDPKLSEAYVWLATIYQHEGMFDETIAILDKGLIELPNDEILQWLRKDAVHYRETGGKAYIAHRAGIALYEKGNRSAALKKFREASKTSPDLAAAHLWMARILYEQREYAKSIPEWIAAIKIRPDNEHAHFYLDLSRRNVAENK